MLPLINTVSQKMNTNKLPVFRIIKESFALLIRNWKPFSQGLAPSYAVILILSISQSVLKIDSTLLFSILIAIASVFFAISCHRLTILGHASIPRFGIYKWGGREWKFVGWGLVVYFYYMLIFIFAGASISLLLPLLPEQNNSMSFFIIIGIFGILPAFYIFARLSLFFPAIAVDKKVNWDLIWAMSKGNGWRLVITSSLIPIIISATLSFFTEIHIVIDAIVLIVQLLTVPLAVVILSLSFQTLDENQDRSNVKNG